MIVVDALQRWGHRLGPSCHMISTLPGPDGSAELCAFAARLGLRPAWLQHAGTEREHFDLFGSRRDDAVRAGATEVDRRAFVAAIRAKRAALVEVPRG